ncbi:uncharacterized protein LOC123292846 [Chrysoperla carnea]|uniref:uncharacterized protein LOC123292846 n=1 Tax=Chrysoperla carnea TaxID=189513 RepID=UPI001D094DD6|nr:uncharacterized protein LOC123292846 [Chrysoperla carnea]
MALEQEKLQHLAKILQETDREIEICEKLIRNYYSSLETKDQHNFETNDKKFIEKNIQCHGIHNKGTQTHRKKYLQNRATSPINLLETKNKELTASHETNENTKHTKRKLIQDIFKKLENDIFVEIEKFKKIEKTIYDNRNY